MSKNDSYLEAAQIGDLSALQSYLRLPPEEVNLNYQDANLASALHRAVLSTRNSHETVKLLIEAGIDCGLRDKENRTAAQVAHHLGQTNLLLMMLDWEFRGVPQRDVFYRLLRRNSMEMATQYGNFLKIAPAKAIRLAEEAYEALRMKGVKLDEQTDFEVYLALIRHYGANPTNCSQKDIAISKDELLEYLDFVLQNSDEDNLNETSDEVLMTMREIGKQMFLRNKWCDDDGAMMEIRYCLCAFVAACDGVKNAEIYTVIINKQQVVRFLQFAAKMLRQGNAKLSRRDGKVRKLLRKTFVLLKEWTSVAKIVHYLTEAGKIDLQQSEDRDFKQMFLDRCVQVVGEATKSTKLSPNLSRQIQGAFEIIVSEQTTSCYKFMREFHSHGYSAAKYLLEKENDFNSYCQLQENLKTALNFFESVRSTLAVVVQKRFLAALYKMQTVKQVRSLSLFVNECVVAVLETPDAHQYMIYLKEASKKLIDQLKPQLKNDNHEDLKIIEQRLMSYLHIMSKESLNQFHLSQNFGAFLQMARTCQSIDDYRSLVKFHLLQPGSKYSIQFHSLQRHKMTYIVKKLKDNLIQTNGSGHPAVDTALQLYNLLNCASFSELRKVQFQRTNSGSETYVEEILRESGAYNFYQQVPSEIRKKVRETVDANVFDVARLLRILKLPDSPKLRAYRKQKEDEFQGAFDQKVATLKRLVVRKFQKKEQLIMNLVTGDSLVSGAIEYVLLEICEILLGVKALQKNLHQLDYRVPIVNGNNLRNGLAHDMAMYDVIVGGKDVQVICNAIYYSTLRLKLYDETDWPKPVPFKINKNRKVRDKLHWFEKQQKLFEQLKDIDQFEFKPAEIDKSDILGCRRETKSDLTMHYNKALFQAIQHNIETFMDHIGGARYSRKFQCLINYVGHPLIPRKTPNQMSLSEKAHILLNITMTIGDFCSYQRVTEKYNTSLTYLDAFKCNPAVLNHLEKLNFPLSLEMLKDSIATGNKATFQWLLKKLDLEAINSISPLRKAFGNGQLELVKLLIDISIPVEEDAKMAVASKLNEVLPKLKPYVKNLSSLLKYAVRRDNLEAIETLEAGSTLCSTQNDLLNCVAYFNRTSILKHFLQNKEWRKRLHDKNESGQTPLEMFAIHGNFVAVEMITQKISLNNTQYTADVASAIRSAAYKKHNKIVKFLLSYNPDLLPNMLIELTRLAVQLKNNTLLKFLLNSQGTSLNLSQRFLDAINACNFLALEILLKKDPLAVQPTIPLKPYNAYHAAAQSLSACSKVDFKLHCQRIFDLLKKHNVDPCLKDSAGLTPLHHAVNFQNLEIVRRLHQLAPNTINEPGTTGRTPLVSALIMGNLPIVQYLVENGANPDDLNKFRFATPQGKVPLTFILERNIECLEYAVRKLRLDPDLRDSEQHTLIHYLCVGDDVSRLKFVLERCHADIGACNEIGDTVLHQAIRSNSKAILDYLLERNDGLALLEHANKEGQTALMLATVLPGRLHLVEKLDNAGASKDKLLQMVAKKCRDALQLLEIFKLLQMVVNSVANRCREALQSL